MSVLLEVDEVDDIMVDNDVIDDETLLVLEPEEMGILVEADDDEHLQVHLVLVRHEVELDEF